MDQKSVAVATHCEFCEKSAEGESCAQHACQSELCGEHLSYCPSCEYGYCPKHRQHHLCCDWNSLRPLSATCEGGEHTKCGNTAQIDEWEIPCSCSCHSTRTAKETEADGFWRTPVGRTIGIFVRALYVAMIGLPFYFLLHPFYTQLQHERDAAESYVRQHYVMSDAGRNLRIDALSQKWESGVAFAHCNLFIESCYRVSYGFNVMEGAAVRRVKCEWFVEISDERSRWKWLFQRNSTTSDTHLDFRPNSPGPHVTARPENTEARMLFVSDLSPNTVPIPKGATIGSPH
jgi:hypothetical protein